MTPPFLIYCVLVLAVGLAAMSAQNNLLFWVFGVMVAVLLLSGLVSGLMMRGLRVRRVDPGHGSVGEPLVVRYRLENRNRLVPAFDLLIEELDAPPAPLWRRLAAVSMESLRRRATPAAAREAWRARRRARGRASFWRLMRPARAWVMHVAPRDAVHGEAVFWPTRRGEARFDHVQIRTAFPFGLVRKSLTLSQPAGTLIYPRLYELRRGVLSALTASGALGSRITPHAGGGDDYYGLREYRSGEHLRHIAWKRTAQRDEVVCIERTRPSPPKMRLVLNLTRPTASLRVAGDDVALARRREEDAISLAASLMFAADAAGYEVGLSVAGLPFPDIPMRRSQWHLSRIMATLAAVDLDAKRRAVTGTPGAERGAVVVVHPDRADPGVGRADAWHLTAGQLDQLVTRPIGWDPRRHGRGGERPQPALAEVGGAGEAAA